MNSSSASCVRPGDPEWPSEASWNRLNQEVGGQLIKVQSPLTACLEGLPEPNCADLFKRLKNPYYLGDEVGLTQTLGWVGAWTSRPSVFAVAVRTTQDVAAAVNFARDNNLRVVIKGGGHSYKGTSNAADSLLIWTRRMNDVFLHDAFLPVGSDGREKPMKAVTVESGAMWGRVYEEVTTKAGRYVQGGGCLTVGVAGLIQSGGFGSFSKAYGLAAASLLEAEIVTADGVVRTANGYTNPDLFWAIKGGGGGSFGVVTRLTLQTHSLPEFFGRVSVTIQAKSENAFRQLISKVISFYSEALLNPHWGEQVALRPENVLEIKVVCQGVDRQEVEALWRPFFDWLAGDPANFKIVSPAQVMTVPARHYWDPQQRPDALLADFRTAAPASNVFWAGNLEEAGMVLHGYQSAWIPVSLLKTDQQRKLVDSLFEAARHWEVVLHVNKGLAGAATETIDAARNTAMNPAVLDAFALLICAAAEPPAYPGIPGREPDLPAARHHQKLIGKAMHEIRKVLPRVGSYVAESDFFEEGWQKSFWGPNYPRLLAVKDRYDPDDLFSVHHGVGCERRSVEGPTDWIAGANCADSD
jgi:FAD/FMN-containing dehydrogenase